MWPISSFWSTVQNNIDFAMLVWDLAMISGIHPPHSRLSWSRYFAFVSLHCFGKIIRLGAINSKVIWHAFTWISAKKRNSEIIAFAIRCRQSGLVISKLSLLLNPGTSASTGKTMRYCSLDTKSSESIFTGILPRILNHSYLEKHFISR